MRRRILAGAVAAALAVWGAYRLGRIGPADTRARMLRPANGDREFNAGSPFVWTAVPDARAYRLRLRTVFGSASVFDSGVIHVTRCLVPALPAKRWLAGTLGTQVGTGWRTVSFYFRPVGSPAASAGSVETALWATDFVRMMANSANRPRPGTLLGDVVRKNRRVEANCLDYCETLISILGEARIPARGRYLNVAFNSNGFDGHSLVELFDSETNRWMMLDPTFDLSILRSVDGAWASAEEVSEAARAQNWGAISYRFLGRKGDRLARNYYIDYPLLFLNVYHDRDPFFRGKGYSPLPFLERESLPFVQHAQAVVLVQSTTRRVVAVVDGDKMVLDCDGIDGTSKIFPANSVALPPGDVGKTSLYRIRRYEF